MKLGRSEKKQIHQCSGKGEMREVTQILEEKKDDKKSEDKKDDKKLIAEKA